MEALWQDGQIVLRMYFRILQSDILQDGKAVLFREIVKNVLMELRLPNTIHVNGLDVLTTSAGLSGDYIHPNNRGVEEMAKNLTEIISKGVK